MGRRVITLVAALVALAPATASAQVTTLDPSYEVIRESNVEIPMTDGTVLVADVYRPRPKAGQPADQRFPCLFEMTPYRKEMRAAEAAGTFPARGFVYMEVDARGTGGSSGQYDGVFLEQEQVDGYDGVEWLATKYPHCDGRVGLFGGSYSGINQYLIASSPKGTPPHLRTLAPQRALSDLYRDIVYVGGIVTASFGLIWSGGTEGYNLIGADPQTSPDPALALQALIDHRSNDLMFTTYLGQPFDSPFYRSSSVIDRLRKLNLPIFHLEGWYDAFTRGQLQLIGRLLDLERKGAVRGPNYAVVGPWNHSGSHFLDHPPYDKRLIEWYRHWLDEGPRPAWFDEPRISYCEMVAALDGDCAWRHSDSWPLKNTQAGRWYLNAGGTLSRKAPEHSGTSVGSWIYNPLAGQGENLFSKWDNAAGVPQRDADQAVEDEWKGLTFSTVPLEQNLVVTGPIELRLKAITNPVPGAEYGVPAAIAGIEQLLPPYLDTDFVVKLSDVDASGRSTLIQTGMLRASHRRLDPKRTRLLQPAPYHDEAHQAPVVAGKPTDYAIEIWPTSKRFAKGHRLRIALYSADTANHLTLLKPVTNTVLAGSQLLLPEPGPAAKKKAKPKKRKAKKRKPKKRKRNKKRRPR